MRVVFFIAMRVEEGSVVRIEADGIPPGSGWTGCTATPFRIANTARAIGADARPKKEPLTKINLAL